MASAIGNVEVIVTEKDLSALVAEARKAGFKGVALWSNDGRTYMAACTNKHGAICDPRNWDDQPTPEAALTDLFQRLQDLNSR